MVTSYNGVTTQAKRVNYTLNLYTANITRFPLFRAALRQTDEDILAAHVKYCTQVPEVLLLDHNTGAQYNFSAKHKIITFHIFLSSISILLIDCSFHHKGTYFRSTLDPLEPLIVSSDSRAVPLRLIT